MKMIYWGVVVTFAVILIVTGCLALTSKPTYDEPTHRAKIVTIYPSVDWPTYRDTAREICGLGEQQFRHVIAMAAQAGPEASQAMVINTAYLCPERSADLATLAR
jgi:hypothetical protein